MASVVFECLSLAGLQSLFVFHLSYIVVYCLSSAGLHGCAVFGGFFFFFWGGGVIRWGLYYLYFANRWTASLFIVCHQLDWMVV